MKPMRWREGRPMARCELHTRKPEAAVRSLLPYLHVKRDQALLLLAFCRIKASPKSEHRVSTVMRARHGSLNSRRRWTTNRNASMEELRERLLALHEGVGPSNVGEGGVEVCDAANIPTLAETEKLAYLAGIIDSDGNLRIERKKAQGMLAPHYRVNIRASQVVPSAAIELLASTFGGNVRIVRPRQPHHRLLATWSLHDGRAAAAVEALLPFLIVKRREAELLLRLRTLKGLGKKGFTEWIHPNRWRRAVRMRKQCYTPDQVAEFESLHRAVQALHSGGQTLDGLARSPEKRAPGPLQSKP